MAAALSSDLRSRFIGLLERGLSARASARHLDLAPSTGVRFARQFRQTGHLEPGKLGRRKGESKYAAHLGFFKEMIDQDPDMTLHELQGAALEALDVHIPRSSLSRVLLGMGLTFKKRRSSLPSDLSLG